MITIMSANVCVVRYVLPRTPLNIHFVYVSLNKRMNENECGVLINYSDLVCAMCVTTTAEHMLFETIHTIPTCRIN